MALCARTGTDPSVLARAGLMLVEERPELAVPDPGAGSFERDELAEGAGERVSRLWLPRLQLSAPSRATPEEIRIALAAMLALCAPAEPPAQEAAAPKPDDAPPAPAPSAPPSTDHDNEVARLRDENAQLRAALDQVSPKALPQPPRTATQAAWFMGFANAFGLTPELVTGRYRQLARIYHPDTGIAGDSTRMAQLTAARGVLIQHLKAAAP